LTVVGYFWAAGRGSTPARGGTRRERAPHAREPQDLGRPGLDPLPRKVAAGKATGGKTRSKTNNAQHVGKTPAHKGGALEIGVRPEFVSFAKSGLPAKVVKVSDAGRFRIVEADTAGGAVKLLVGEGDAIPSGSAHLAFDSKRTQVYEGGWIAAPGGRS